MWNMKVTITPIVIGSLGTVDEALVKGTRGLGNKRTDGDHPNYCITEIGQNTEKRSEYLRRYALTQTPMIDYQLTLMGKLSRGNSHNNNDNIKLLVLLSNMNKVVGDRSRGRPEGSLFDSYYTEVLGRALLLSLDCSTLPSIRTLYYWVLNKEVSSTILKVFGMTQPGKKPSSPGPLANTLPTSSRFVDP